MIILKVTKKQGLTLSLKKKFSKKPQGGGGGGKLTPPAFLGLSIIQFFNAAKLLYADSFLFSMFSINLLRRYAKIW